MEFDLILTLNFDSTVLLADLDRIVSGPNQDGKWATFELAREHVIHHREEAADLALFWGRALQAGGFFALADFVGLLARQGERVHRVLNGLGLRFFHDLFVVAASEGIATSDFVNALVDHKVLTNPDVLGREAAFGLERDAGSAHKSSAVDAGVLDFALDDQDMATLDALTSPEAISKFVELYRKCVIRDTPVTDGVKMAITED